MLELPLNRSFTSALSKKVNKQYEKKTRLSESKTSSISEKLVGSFQEEAGGERNNEFKKPVFKMSLAGNPSSCVFEIRKQKYRNLIDSGAAC